jgi:chromate transporter
LRGSVALALGTILPSFIMILLIAMFFANFAENRVVEAIFKGIRPAVVALIAAPCLRLARTAHITLTNLWLPVTTVIAICLLGISPVYVVALVAIGSFLYGKLTQEP